MEDNKLTQEMKRHAVIVAIHANHSDLEISRFLKVARSFVNKFVQKVQGIIDEDPSKSIRAILKDLQVSKHNSSHYSRRHPVQVLRDA